MKSTALQDYLTGLKRCYDTVAGEQYWQGLMARVHGVSDEDIAKLTAKFPQVPASLIELLQFVDGTYWRDYGGETVSVFMFGSIPDEFAYPCYLNSCEQMLASDDEVAHLADYINRDIDPDSDWGISIDDRIIDDVNQVKWLHLADCMNNGGTSQLFIDFSPSKTGKVGQVVMYLHDPDELTVVADSFDEYLQKLIDTDFAFIDEDYDYIEELLWD